MELVPKLAEYPAYPAKETMPAATLSGLLHGSILSGVLLATGCSAEATLAIVFSVALAVLIITSLRKKP